MPILGRAVRGTSIVRPGKIWLPQLRYLVNVKIEIDNTVITSDVLDPTTFTWATLRNGLGLFNITLNNDTRKYLDVFEEGDVVKFYGDFTDATTQIFEGKIEEPRYGFDNGFKVYINGMKNPELLRKFTKSYTEAQSNNVLQDVLDTKYGTGTFTYANIDNDMTTLISPQYENEPIINVLQDILERAEYDGYIDINNDTHTFLDTGQSNSNEAAIQGQNILNITPFGKDTLKRRNKVTLYGATIENCPIIKTVSTTTTSWDKEEIINVGNANTLIDALERANFKLNNLSNLRQEGAITCSALATIRPGNKIPCRVPNAKIEGEYFIPQYTHSFSTLTGWQTMIMVNKPIINISTIHYEHKLKEESREFDNPNEMKNTLILLTFDNENDISSLGGCHISNGKLILDSGNDTGVMISDTFTNINNFTSVELRGEADTDFSLGPSKMEVSSNGGTTYTTVNNFKELTSIISGKKGIIKVTIKSDATYVEPSLESIGLLVNT